MSSDKPDVKRIVQRTLLLTVPETAAELRCAVRTCWRLIAKGDLKTVRLGRSVRITRESLELLIAQGGSK
jgi:excisionase family DNA binding protein